MIVINTGMAVSEEKKNTLKEYTYTNEIKIWNFI